MVPALNDHEILNIAKVTYELGADGFHSHVVRLLGPNEIIFSDWLDKNFPDRKEKVLNQLKEIHNGKIGSSAFGERMRGKGSFALNLQRQMEIAKNLYFKNQKHHQLRTDLFQRPSKNGQLTLF